MKKLFCTLRDRWKAKTPILFSRIIKLSIGIGAAAAAIQTAFNTNSIEAPAWWLRVMPYLVGAGAGASVVAKLTQQYDKNNNPIRKDKEVSDDELDESEIES